MDLEQLYYVGELVGVLAIIASLIFVGMQMRQNTRALKSNAAQASAADYSRTPLAVATNPALIETLTTAGNQPPGRCSAHYATCLGAFAISTLKNLELNYLQWIDGNLSDELWVATKDGATDFIGGSPYISILWQQGMSRNFTASFQQVFRELAEKSKADIAGGRGQFLFSGQNNT